jgi:hypothetical protein
VATTQRFLNIVRKPPCKKQALARGKITFNEFSQNLSDFRISIFSVFFISAEARKLFGDLLRMSYAWNSIATTQG